MASVEIPISDETILEHLRENRGFSEGQTRVVSVKVEQQPPTANSTISHLVKVEVTYGLEIGELRKLADF